MKTQKQQTVHKERLRKLNIWQKESQKQTKVAERPVSFEIDGRFIEVEVEQQDTGVCDEQSKTEEIQSQTEFDPVVGQTDERLLDPKSEVETPMDTNTGADCSNGRTQPINSNKTKLNSTSITSMGTSVISKTATQKHSSGKTRTQSESLSRSRKVTRSSS